MPYLKMAAKVAEIKQLRTREHDKLGLTPKKKPAENSLRRLPNKTYSIKKILKDLAEEHKVFSFLFYFSAKLTLKCYSGCLENDETQKKNRNHDHRFELFQKVLLSSEFYSCSMILDSKVIEFKGMPLFQKARFKTPFDMQGAIQDFACFFYIVEGNMLSFDSRGLNTIQEKEAVLKNCNNYIQRYVPNKDGEECEAIAIYLYPDLLKTIYKNEVPSFLKMEKPPKPEKFIGNKLIDQYMTNLSIYFESPETLDEELGILKLKELMMILLKSQRHDSIFKLLSEIFTPVHVEFKRAIQENLFNPLSIDQLAFICHMSLSTFKREFRKVFNETPARYIKNKRLERAASLLLCSNEAISAIAYETGFQDASTFSATFQDKYSVSPSDYRRTRLETI